MATNVAPKLQPKQAATYRNGSLETTAGKAPEEKCTPRLGPQTFFQSALPETTAGEAPNALRINAVF